MDNVKKCAQFTENKVHEISDVDTAALQGVALYKFTSDTGIPMHEKWTTYFNWKMHRM